MNMECSRVSPFRVGCLAVAVTICIESYSGRPRAINRGLVPRRYTPAATAQIILPDLQSRQNEVLGYLGNLQRAAVAAESAGTAGLNELDLLDPVS